MSVEIEARIYEFMKSGYDLLWDHKKDLEKKSLSILTVTGTIATLIFGIGSFIIVNHTSLLSFETELPYLIFGALVTSITAMIISIDSLRNKLYSFMIADNPKKSPNIGVMKNLIDFLNMDNTTFMKQITWNYAVAIINNSEKNKQKALEIDIAMWLLLATVVLVSVTLCDLFIKIS